MFFYQDGQLRVGTTEKSRAVQDIARSVDGPVYIYDLEDISKRYDALARALSGVRASIHYAMKANSNRGILVHLASRGAGVDTVSGGEVALALEAGVPADRIIFSGVAKSVGEIELALKSRIKQINVESPQELERIATIATRLGVTADVAFRLNPNVSPETHPYITTGLKENKFGMDESFVPDLLRILREHPKALRLRGLTMHIGSLLFDLGVIREAILKTIAVHRRFEAEGQKLDRLDIGGGIGIRYETDDTSSEFAMITAYGEMVRETLKAEKLDVEVLTEPGRILVGRSGLLVGEIQYVKSNGAKRFAILNTGMNHLLRPALYGAKHRILPVQINEGELDTYDVVGPICESSDVFAKNVALPPVQQGELLALADAGAYGFAMSSHYNAHALPHEILI